MFINPETFLIVPNPCLSQHNYDLYKKEMIVAIPLMKWVERKIEEKIQGTNLKAVIAKDTGAFEVSTILSISAQNGVYVSPDYFQKISPDLVSIRVRGTGLKSDLNVIKNMLKRILKLDLEKFQGKILTPDTSNNQVIPAETSNNQVLPAETSTKEYFNFNEIKTLLDGNNPQEVIVAIRALDNSSVKKLEYIRYTPQSAAGAKKTKVVKKPSNRKVKK